MPGALHDNHLEQRIAQLTAELEQARQIGRELQRKLDARTETETEAFDRGVAAGRTWAEQEKGALS